MTGRKGRGGEPDAARLLELARAELLNDVLPQLDGDARYRARLIANALRIVRNELVQDGDPEEADILRRLAESAAAAPAASSLPPDTSLTDALRAGALDGDAAFHDLLVRLTDRRRAAVG